MTNVELVTAADVQLMQGLAQRVAATRPDLISADAPYAELAWVWGQGRARYGATWPRRLWASGAELVAWGWAFLPCQVRRNDGSVTDVTGAFLTYQVHPDHTELVDEVIEWYDGAAAGLERTVSPTAAEEFALKRWAAHGYEPDLEALGDTGDWHQLNERDLTDVEQQLLPDRFRFRTAGEAGPEAVPWTGNTGSGTASYRSYDRDHDIVIDGNPTIEASADPAFLGNPQHWNPEDLLVASLLQCHMLNYLAVCARSGVIVTDYQDTARGAMREAAGNSGQFTEVVLYPAVAVADAAMTDKAAALHREAHEACVVANSVNFPVRHVPTVRVRAVDS